MTITQEELKENLDYNPETGIFIWLKDNKSKKIKGIVAGCCDRYGYIIIRFNKKNYKAHRLAWLYVYGEFPKGQIDHINGVRYDNRIINLRDVTNRENQQNKKIHRNGHLIGVSKNNKKGKFSSYFHYEGKQYHLGNYKSENDCNNIYLEAQNNMQNFLLWYENHKKKDNHLRRTKIKGYCLHKRTKKWYAQIVINGKQKHIGSFNTPEEAHKAYINKIKEFEK